MAWAALMALGLLICAPFVSKPVPDGRAWFLAPVNWPALALATMALTAAILAMPFMRGLATGGRDFWTKVRGAYEGLGSDLIYGVLFCGYLALLGVLGFTISTWIFAQVCVTWSGLRGWRWWLATLVFVAVMVLLLRVGLGLWFPHAWLFDVLPRPFGNLASRYL